MRARIEYLKLLNSTVSNKNTKRKSIGVKFLLYLGRWQLSGLVLAPVLYAFGIESVVIPTVVANLIGGCIFFWVDRLIFKKP